MARPSALVQVRWDCNALCSSTCIELTGKDCSTLAFTEIRNYLLYSLTERKRKSFLGGKYNGKFITEAYQQTYPNGFEAVKDFNLEIEDKEFIIFVGPSGCGKSTTLRMVAGLEDITSGELKIGDKVVNDVEPKDRDIAMVFQNYALYPHMTVYDNMAFGLKLRKVPKDQIDKMVREAARILDLEGSAGS